MLYNSSIFSPVSKGENTVYHFWECFIQARLKLPQMKCFVSSKKALYISITTFFAISTFLASLSYKEYDGAI